ncbi:MAG: T9SS type A sorting domain-containing protein [Flavobacteriales bacterium]|nr:T9SS type A sorting domain-containing protein [Flavobacteriales bacterium]
MAQENLVVNGGFEEISDCNFGSGDISFATGWFNLYNNETGQGADVFNRCSTDPIYLVPSTGGGFQEPKEGDGFGGFIAYNLFEAPRGTLTDQLEKDTTYAVEFWINLANTSREAVAGLGLVFMDSAWSLPQTSYDTIKADILYPDFILDTMQWVRISKLYFANGTEQFFSIGLFDTIISFNIEPLGGSRYYFLDAVNIHKANKSEINGISQQELEFSIYPNPTSEFLFVKSREPLLQVELFDLQGRPVLGLLENNGTWKGDMNPLSAGIYLLEATAENGNRSTKRLVVQH